MKHNSNRVVFPLQYFCYSLTVHKQSILELQATVDVSYVDTEGNPLEKSHAYVSLKTGK